jgi:CBS domain-containing protein
MKSTAASIMTTDFPSLLPETPITEAIRIFRGSSHQHGRRLFGIIVTDKDRHLVGMLSMYDILLYMRPKHIQVWGTMEDLDVAGLLDTASRRIKSILVGDIMTPEVITIGPNVDLFMILDIMIKKHIRRLPVVKDQHIMGIVYISDLFNHLLERIGD